MIKLHIQDINEPLRHGKQFRIAPRWIVIHYTGVANAGALAIAKSMAKSGRDVSSHFAVDEQYVIRMLPEQFIAWHCKQGKCEQPKSTCEMSLSELACFKSNSWRYDLAAKNHLKWISSGEDFCGNSQSIGVDICVKKLSTKTNKATDKDWYFDDNAVENAAKLVALLCRKYGISIDHVIRHADATGKPCPRPFVSLPGDGDEKFADGLWDLFKKTVCDFISLGVEEYNE